MKVNHFLLAPSSLNAILHMFIFQTNLNRFGLVHTKFAINYPMLHVGASHQKAEKLDLEHAEKETILKLLKNLDENLKKIQSSQN